MKEQEQHPSQRGGYITLLGLIVLGGVALGLTTSLLTTGLSATQSASAWTAGRAARFSADACAEEALQQIRAAANFFGSGSLTFGVGTCHYSVIRGTGGRESRIVSADGNGSGAVRRVRVMLSSITPRLIVTSWDEIAQF